MDINKTYTMSLPIIAGLVILATVFIAAGKADAATITVDDSGGADYTTIQAAVNAASAGDTVYVYNGAYYSNSSDAVSISKSINLTGESNQSTIIRGGGSYKGIYVTATHVNITNINVDHFYRGIYMASGYYNITYTLVTNNTVDGIYSSGVSYNNITNNVLFNNAYGIHATSGTGNNISQNTITESNSYQLCIDGGSGNTVIWNNISDGSAYGVYLASTTSNDIRENTIANCSYEAIYFDSGSNNNNVTSNTMTGCGTGAHLRPGANNNSISSNTITDCWTGVHFESSSNNTLTGNTITGSNSYYGSIYLYSSPGNNVSQNTLGEGILLDAYSAGTVTLDGNTVGGKPLYFAKDMDSAASPTYVENGTCGQAILYNSSGFVIGNNSFEKAALLLLNSSGNTIRENTIANCSSYCGSIYIYFGSNNTLSGNTITNSGDGIYLKSSSNNTIAGSVITNGSGYNGMRLEDGSNDNSITGTAITTYANGILLNTGSNNTVANCTIANCTSLFGVGTGIYLYSDWDTESAGNTITGCDYGVYMYTSSNGSMVSNAISGSSQCDIYMASASSAVSVNDTFNGSMVSCDSGSMLAVKNYLTVYASYSSNSTAISGAQASMSDGGAEIFIGQTGSDGTTAPILITDRIYNGSSTATENTTNITVSSSGITFVDNPRSVDAGSSHTETFVSAYMPEPPVITTLPYTDTDGNYTINWTASNHSLGYVIQENGVYIYNGTNTICTLANRTNGNYTYVVVGWNANGTSENSTTLVIVVDIPMVPSAPSIATAAYTDTDANYSIDWTISDYATKYMIYENGSLIFNGTNTTLSYAFSGKADGAYTYTVQAWNINGTSGASAPVAITVDILKLPSAPSITTVAYTDMDGNYSINWTASPYATNYIIYENGTQIFNATNSSRTYAFTGMANSTYAYKVAAWNANGTSADSAEVSVTVSIPVIVIIPNLPSAPSITTVAYTDTDGNYLINWTASNYAVKYMIYENGSLIFNSTSTALSYAFSGKSNGTYTYKMRAWNQNGTSAESSEVNVTVSVPAIVIVPNLPSAPSITTVAYTDIDGNYSVNWTASSYASSYALEEGGAVIYNGTATTHVLSGKPNGTYSYRAAAWNANGTSNKSAAVSVVVAIPAAAAPQNNAPVVSAIPSQSIVLGATFTYNVSAADADGDALTYSANIGAINASSGRFSITPASAGAYTVTIYVNDTKAEGNASFTITVSSATTNQTSAAAALGGLDKTAAIALSVVIVVAVAAAASYALFIRPARKGKGHAGNKPEKAEELEMDETPKGPDGKEENAAKKEEEKKQ